jgi:GAF domain-containing protein
MASVTGPVVNRVCDVHIGTSDEAVTLRAVITTVFSTLEIDEVLAGVVDIATEATGCHACLIYLLESDRLLLRAASSVHSKFVGQIEMGVGEGVTGWVAEHKEAALIRDSALRDPRMRYFPELEEERWQSMAAVPVTARSGDVIGVIVLHTAAPREFTEEDVELLTHTATLVGGAIEDAQLYEEARERVASLTQLAEVSQRLAAATRHERLYEAATEGARALLNADLCQLFRLEPGGGGELRLAASDPPEASGPRPQGGALLLELLSRGRHGGSSRELWPDHEDAALLTTPLVASDEQLGLLCVLRPRRFGAGDEELLRALADQTAMGLERAELIERLTARDRVKDMFDALADRSPDGVVLGAAPPGCDLSRPHVFLHGEHAGGNGAGADWEAVATRLGARLRGRDQTGFFDAGRHGLRAVVLMPRTGGAERVIAACESVAAAEHVVLGVSAPGSGIAESRQALREAQRAAQIALTLRPGGGALGYEQLGAYKYLVDLRLDESPRDRHWTAVEALLVHDRQRRTALLDTLEEYLARRRSVADTARTLYIHPNTLRQRLARIERVTGLKLEGEDLLALELAVKLVRLDDARRRAGA